MTTTRTIIAALLTLTLTACGALHMNSVPRTSITLDQATHQLDTYLHAAITAAATTTGIPITPERNGFGPGNCGPPMGTGPSGRQFADSGYFLRGIPPERNPDIYTAIQQFWDHNGWTIYNDRRPQINSIYARSTDNYEMVIQTSGGESRAISLGGNSPCVWPTGTAPDNYTGG